MNKRSLLILLGIVIIGLIVAIATNKVPGFEGLPLPSTGNNFSDYPTHELPEGANIIDDYFYTYNGTVYLNSVSSTSSIRIPDAGADTFKRLTDFTELPNPAVRLDCVRPGQYAFYADDSRVYFYELWLNSKFKHSEVETLVGVTPDNFEVLDASSFKAAPGTYMIDYETATSSCSYILKLDRSSAQ